MIKYRKAREIIDQVVEDFETLDDLGLVDYTKLYKIIRRCNALLGEKINPEKQEVIRIKNFKGQLPDDFYNLNHAFLCRSQTTNVKPPSGFHIEYKTICKDSHKCAVCAAPCDNDYVIYQMLDDNWTQYTNLEVIRANTKSFSKCETQCPNLFSKSSHEFEIGQDNSITTNFKDGFLYINYMGTLEDCDEDLLIIDHPLVEPYYEAELTKQILKTAVYNKSADLVEVYRDSRVELSRARSQALSFVNMPEYTEMQNIFKANRKLLYNKYFAPIINC